MCVRVCVCVSYMLDERLHYLVAVWHVSNHVFHVVLRRPDQSWPKHQSQVTRFHLDTGHTRVHTNPLCEIRPLCLSLSLTHTLFLSELSATVFRWPIRNLRVW